MWFLMQTTYINHFHPLKILSLLPPSWVIVNNWLILFMYQQNNYKIFISAIKTSHQSSWWVITSNRQITECSETAFWTQPNQADRFNQGLNGLQGRKWHFKKTQRVFFKQISAPVDWKSRKIQEIQFCLQHTYWGKTLIKDILEGSFRNPPLLLQTGDFIKMRKGNKKKSGVEKSQHWHKPSSYMGGKNWHIRKKRYYENERTVLSL